jgi:hypothetical protein
LQDEAMADTHLQVATDDRPMFHPEKPRLRWGFPLLIGGLIAAGAVIYYFWQLRVEPQRPPAVSAPDVAAQSDSAPRIEHPIETAPATQLPALSESDATAREMLAGLIGSAAFDQLFHSQDLVRRFVATVDNLPRKIVALRLMPVKPAPGAFRVSGAPDRRVIGSDNAARYTPYVRAFEALDSAKAVALYVRFYPLFQQAYAELGYPSGYFNDRLFAVIDHLLATPDTRAPIALMQPKVLYEYADPELEDLSAGQKMLLRMGPDNEARVKAKLRELKKALSRGA